MQAGLPAALRRELRGDFAQPCRRYPRIFRLAGDGDAGGDPYGTTYDVSEIFSLDVPRKCGRIAVLAGDARKSVPWRSKLVCSAFYWLT